MFSPILLSFVIIGIQCMVANACQSGGAFTCPYCRASFSTVTLKYTVIVEFSSQFSITEWDIGTCKFSDITSGHLHQEDLAIEVSEVDLIACGGINIDGSLSITAADGIPFVITGVPNIDGPPTILADITPEDDVECMCVNGGICVRDFNGNIIGCDCPGGLTGPKCQDCVSDADCPADYPFCYPDLVTGNDTCHECPETGGDEYCERRFPEERPFCGPHRKHPRYDFINVCHDPHVKLLLNVAGRDERESFCFLWIEEPGTERDLLVDQGVVVRVTFTSDGFRLGQAVVRYHGVHITIASHPGHLVVTGGEDCMAKNRCILNEEDGRVEITVGDIVVFVHRSRGRDTLDVRIGEEYRPSISAGGLLGILENQAELDLVNNEVTIGGATSSVHREGKCYKLDKKDGGDFLTELEVLLSAHHA